jgi:hypothetical protein
MLIIVYLALRAVSCFPAREIASVMAGRKSLTMKEPGLAAAKNSALK